MQELNAPIQFSKAEAELLISTVRAARGSNKVVITLSHLLNLIKASINEPVVISLQEIGILSTVLSRHTNYSVDDVHTLGEIGVALSKTMSAIEAKNTANKALLDTTKESTDNKEINNGPKTTKRKSK